MNSLEFLKEILEPAKDTVEAENATDPEEDRDRAKEALTELFNEAKGTNTHIIVERIVGRHRRHREDRPLRRLADHHRKANAKCNKPCAARC
jgi:hypothetical protein